MIDLEKYRNLKVNQKVRVVCCKARQTTAIVSRSRTEMRGYCFVCGASPTMIVPSSLADDLASLKGLTDAGSMETPLTTPSAPGIQWPEGMVSALPMPARVWLASYSISPELSARLRVGWSISLARLILPCFSQSGELVYWQGRALEKWRKPKYLTAESMQATGVTFSSVRSGVVPLHDGPLVLVEDIVSAVRVGHVYPTHALLGTALTDGKLAAILGSAGGAGSVYTWFDADGAGSKARQACSRRLPLVGLRARHLRTEKDPKNYSNRQIEEIVRQHD